MAGDLWAYSLATYARPGVAEACLFAQESYGADVNLLLWAAWLASNGHALTAPEVAEAQAATLAWRDNVVRRLRGVRRWLKSAGSPSYEGLRTQIKAAELEAERLQQAMLSTLPADHRADTDPATALTINLALLLPPEPAMRLRSVLRRAG